MNGQSQNGARPPFPKLTWSSDGFAFKGQATNTPEEPSPKPTSPRGTPAMNKKRAADSFEDRPLAKRQYTVNSPHDGSDKYASPRSPATTYADIARRDSIAKNPNPLGIDRYIPNETRGDRRDSDNSRETPNGNHANGYGKHSGPQQAVQDPRKDQDQASSTTFPSPMSVSDTASTIARPSGSGGSTPQSLAPLAPMLRTAAAPSAPPPPDMSKEVSAEIWKTLAVASATAGAAKSARDIAGTELQQREHELKRLQGSITHQDYPTFSEVLTRDLSVAEEAFKEKDMTSNKALGDLQKVFARAFGGFANSLPTGLSSVAGGVPDPETRENLRRRDADMRSLQQKLKEQDEDNKALRNEVDTLKSQMGELVAKLSSTRPEPATPADFKFHAASIEDKLHILRSSVGPVSGLVSETRRLGSEQARIIEDQKQFGAEQADISTELKRVSGLLNSLKNQRGQGDASIDKHLDSAATAPDVQEPKGDASQWKHVIPLKQEIKRMGQVQIDLLTEQDNLKTKVTRLEGEQDLDHSTLNYHKRRLNDLDTTLRKVQEVQDGVQGGFQKFKDDLSFNRDRVRQVRTTLESHVKDCTNAASSPATNAPSAALEAEAKTLRAELLAHKTNLGQMKNIQSKLQESVEKVEKANGTLRQDTDGIKKKLDAVEGAGQRTETRVEEVNQALQEADARVDTNEKTIGDLTERLNQHEEQNEERYQQVANANDRVNDKRIKEAMTQFEERLSSTESGWNGRTQILEQRLEDQENAQKEMAQSVDHRIQSLEHRLADQEKRPGDKSSTASAAATPRPGEQHDMHALGPEFLSLPVQLAELGGRTKDIEADIRRLDETFIQDVESQLAEMKLETEQQLNDLRGEVRTRVDKAVSDAEGLRGKLSEVQKQLSAPTRQAQPSPQSRSPVNGAGATPPQPLPQSLYAPVASGRILPSHNGPNGVPSPRLSNDLQLNAVRESSGMVANRISQIENGLDACRAFCQDLDNRFNNLTTDEMCRRMVHQIQQLYPDAPNFLASLRGCQHEVGNLVQRIRNMETTFPASAASAAAQVEGLNATVNKMVKKMEGFETDVKALQENPEGKFATTVVVNSLHAKVDNLKEALRKEETARYDSVGYASSSLEKELKKTTKSLEEVKTRVDGHDGELESVNAGLTLFSNEMQQTQIAVQCINKTLPKPVDLLPWPSEQQNK